MKPWCYSPGGVSDDTGSESEVRRTPNKKLDDDKMMSLLQNLAVDLKKIKQEQKELREEQKQFHEQYSAELLQLRKENEEIRNENKRLDAKTRQSEMN
nr:unnamed protein product [Callosobruchus analis]